jgi:hypothetical protein
VVIRTHARNLRAMVHITTKLELIVNSTMKKGLKFVVMRRLCDDMRNYAKFYNELVF